MSDAPFQAEASVITAAPPDPRLRAYNDESHNSIGGIARKYIIPGRVLDAYRMHKVEKVRRLSIPSLYTSHPFIVKSPWIEYTNSYEFTWLQLLAENSRKPRAGRWAGTHNELRCRQRHHDAISVESDEIQLCIPDPILVKDEGWTASTRRMKRNGSSPDKRVGREQS